MAATAKPPASTAGGAVAVPTVRPVNRARRDTNSHALGRHSRNSAGKRTGSLSDEASANGGGTLPYGIFFFPFLFYLASTRPLTTSSRVRLIYPYEACR